MRTLVLLASLILVQTLSFASPFQASLDVALLSAKSTHKPTESFLQKLQQAVVPIHLGVNCTGNYISNDGYMLTALHCLCLCYEMTSQEVALPGLEKGAYLIRKELPGRCLSLPTSGGFGNSGPAYTLVATGSKGFIEEEIQKFLLAKKPELLKALLGSDFGGIDGNGDFAILKVHNSNNNRSCLKIANKTPEVDQVVWNLSYPYFTRGGETFSGKPLYSIGVMTEGIEQNSNLRLAPEQDQQRFKLAYENPAVFFSSVDVETSSSGSAILNPEEQIVGIAIGVIKAGSEYVYGSTKSLRIEHIVQTLTTKLGPEKVKEIFNCPDSEN